MNIVINTSVLLTPATGVGTFVRHAARALAQATDAHCYTYYDGRFSERLSEPEESGGAGRKVKALLDRFPAARGMARGVARRLHRLSARGRPFDLYWEPNYVPLDLDARRLVVTVHDLSLKTHPEWHPKDRVAHFARHFGKGLARADAITADSEFTRGELLSLCRLDPERVRVVYPGCDPSCFRPQKLGTGTNFPGARPPKLVPVPNFPFVLAVGSPRDPRKNIPRLLDAWATLPTPVRSEYKLVLAAGLPSTFGLRPSALPSEDVLSLGYLSTDDLARAYASATALVYSSLYEGFGLPPLEAMASGCPVVASDIPPVREVCGDAAEYVDPTSVEGIASGLERVLSDDARRLVMSARGMVRAKGFTWQSTAGALEAVFEAAAGHS